MMRNRKNDDAFGLEIRLRDRLRGHYAIGNVSGAYTTINISGTGSINLLCKSCTYDFHPDNFPAGKCVRTLVARVGAMISRYDDGSFALVARRSFAEYLWQWLCDAVAIPPE